MLQPYNPKNETIICNVGGQLLPRAEAKISIFDSIVIGGDAVWEGLRIYPEGAFCLDHHIDRLRASAHALAFTDIPSRETVEKAIFDTLEANGMRDEAHMRITLTRGEKRTSGMDPRLNTKGSCLIVLAEWKPLVYDNSHGITVITSAIRRNGPQFLDSKIHHSNLLNNILAKIQANHAGADAAIMLDHAGFVSELNDTNLFMAKGDTLLTPHADACLPGITRGLVIQVARDLGIEVVERNISLTEFYNADEAFATGTMGELTPVVEADGRTIPSLEKANLLPRIREAYHTLRPSLCRKLPF